MKTGWVTMERFDNRLPNSVGSSRIRCRWLLPHWKEAEEMIIGKKYGARVYQKVYAAPMMDHFKGPQVLDLCDPDWLEGKPVFEFVDRADATVTSTEALASFVRKLRPKAKVLCIPDRVNIPEHQPVKTKHEGAAKSIAWFGYSQNVHYVEKTFPELIKHGLSLTIISDEPYTPPSAYKALSIRNVPYSYPGLYSELSQHDLVLMPGTGDDERGKFKSNNKMLTAWCLGLPVVIEPDDLEKYMDPKRREEEAKVRLQEVHEKWDVALSAKEYRALMESL